MRLRLVADYEVLEMNRVRFTRRGEIVVKSEAAEATLRVLCSCARDSFQMTRREREAIRRGLSLDGFRAAGRHDAEGRVVEALARAIPTALRRIPGVALREAALAIPNRMTLVDATPSGWVPHRRRVRRRRRR